MSEPSLGCQDREEREERPSDCSALVCTGRSLVCSPLTDSAHCIPATFLLTRKSPLVLSLWPHSTQFNKLGFYCVDITSILVLDFIIFYPNVRHRKRIKMLFVRRAEERSLSLQRIFLKLDLNLNITFVLFHSAATQTKLVFHFCVSFANLNMTQLKLQASINNYLIPAHLCKLRQSEELRPNAYFTKSTLLIRRTESTTLWHCVAAATTPLLELGCCCWFTWMHFANYSILVHPGNTAAAAVPFTFGAWQPRLFWRCRDA